MDIFVLHALESGVISVSDLARLSRILEQDLVAAISRKVKLPKITTAMLLHHCMEAYACAHVEEHTLTITPGMKAYAQLSNDARGCLHIPKEFCASVHTNCFKVNSVIDGYGNEVLLISAAHLPDPSLNITPVMPEPVHDD